MQQKEQKAINLKKTKVFDFKVDHLKNIYTNIFNEETDDRVSRYQLTTGRFTKIYGDEPQYFIRAPALLNLFGDNNFSGSGFDQLGFPIEQDIVIAVKKGKNKEIRIEHSQQIVYPSKKLGVDYTQSFIDPQGNNQGNQQVSVNQENKNQSAEQLTNLFLVGYKAALTGVDPSSLNGLDIMIDFNFQQKSSLNFSNAYALACAMATLAINTHVKPNYDVLYFNLQKFKNIVSKESSDVQGFNQLKQMIGIKNNFGYQEKEEGKLVLKQQAFPALDKKPGNNYVFLFADSLTEKIRMMTTGKRIHLRKCEVRIGIYLLLKGMEVEKTEGYNNIKQVQEFFQYTLEDMKECVESHIEDREYELKELEQIFKQPLSKICSDIPYIDQVLSVNNTFNPYKRLMFYITEQMRLEKMVNLFKNQEGEQNNQKIWQNIGSLMNESFDSQMQHLDCQSENIQILQQQMIKNGCIGCKLIGNGWDGILVGLVPEIQAKKAIDTITEDYYLNKELKLSVTDDIFQYLYKSHPNGSAQILDPSFEIWFA